MKKVEPITCSSFSNLVEEALSTPEARETLRLETQAWIDSLKGFTSPIPKLTFPTLRIPCYECGFEAVPAASVDGWAIGKSAKHFCCLGCFWKWNNRVIKSRDSGGRLDRKINFD